MSNYLPVLVHRGQDYINEIFERVGFVYLAGGFARWACSPHKEPIPFGDIDLAVANEDHFKMVDSKLKKWLDGPINDTPNARTYKFADTTLQLIKPFFKADSLEGILDQIDFSVVRVGIKSATEAIADPNFKEDETNQVLRIKFLDNSLGSLQRIIKYSLKGYKIADVELIKLLDAWRNQPAIQRSTVLDYVKANPKANMAEVYSLNEGKGLLAYAQASMLDI